MLCKRWIIIRTFYTHRFFLSVENRGKSILLVLQRKYIWLLEIGNLKGNLNLSRSLDHHWDLLFVRRFLLTRLEIVVIDPFSESNHCTFNPLEIGNLRKKFKSRIIVGSSLALFTQPTFSMG